MKKIWVVPVFMFISGTSYGAESIVVGDLTNGVQYTSSANFIWSGPDNANLSNGYYAYNNPGTMPQVFTIASNRVCGYCGSGTSTSTTCASSGTKIRIQGGSYYMIYDTNNVSRFLYCSNSNVWTVAWNLGGGYVPSTTVTNGVCWKSPVCSVTTGQCTSGHPIYPSEMDLSTTCTTPTHCINNYFKNSSTCTACTIYGFSPAYAADYNNTNGTACYLLGNYTDTAGSFNISDKCYYTV